MKKMPLSDSQTGALIRVALSARLQAYAPYSGFLVGAALECADGRVFTGCNIESVSFSPTICAERAAFAAAISAGARHFVRIAVVGGPSEDVPSRICPPCGVCRQFLAEFCPPDFPVILAVDETRYEIATLSGLLPQAFAPGITADAQAARRRADGDAEPASKRADVDEDDVRDGRAEGRDAT